jgi:hypothetical protein
MCRRSEILLQKVVHDRREELSMSKMTLACSLVAGALSALPVVANADDVSIRFKGGIGVIPTGSTNTVTRGVTGAGQIWVIEKLDAKVEVSGHITVEGKGLVLGAGNNAGRAAGQSVFATLICEAAAPFTERNTSLVGVPLTVTGDFKINDMLHPAPPLSCASPMLLIRNANGQTWFAVGILRPKDD